MRYKLFPLLIAVMLLSAACSDHTQSDGFSKESVPESSCSSEAAPSFDASDFFETRSEKFLRSFRHDYPDFELLEYVNGTDENAPIELAAIAQNKKTGSSSTLFILDDHGLGQVVLAGEHLAVYRQEDGLQLDKNVISLSLDVILSDTDSEIHDFKLTVTQTEDHQGTFNTLYTSHQTIRSDES